MSAVRGSDTAARLDGDEFALIFPDTDVDGARNVIAKIRDGLQAALGASDLPVSCSIGVVTSLDPATSPQGLLAVADALMYQVKRVGKGEVSFRVLGGQVPTEESGNGSEARAPPPHERLAVPIRLTRPRSRFGASAGETCSEPSLSTVNLRLRQ
jgi:hypothetical protein